MFAFSSWHAGLVIMGNDKSAAGSGRPARIVSPVKGGWVKREAATGRFVEVGTDKGTHRATAASEAAIEKASNDHHDALKRLANR